MPAGEYGCFEVPDTKSEFNHWRLYWRFDGNYGAMMIKDTKTVLLRFYWRSYGDLTDISIYVRWQVVEFIKII